MHFVADEPMSHLDCLSNITAYAPGERRVTRDQGSHDTDIDQYMGTSVTVPVMCWPVVWNPSPDSMSARSGLVTHPASSRQI